MRLTHPQIVSSIDHRESFTSVPSKAVYKNDHWAESSNCTSDINGCSNAQPSKRPIPRLHVHIPTAQTSRLVLVGEVGRDEHSTIHQREGSIECVETCRQTRDEVPQNPTPRILPIDIRIRIPRQATQPRKGEDADADADADLPRTPSCLQTIAFKTSSSSVHSRRGAATGRIESMPREKRKKRQRSRAGQGRAGQAGWVKKVEALLKGFA